MAKLAASGIELLRVQRSMPTVGDVEHAKQMAYFAKGPILTKAGWRQKDSDLPWHWSGWKRLRDGEGKPACRDISLDLIADVKARLEATGWQVLAYGAKEWK